MMTATKRKTSLKNKHSRNCNYFAIVPSCSHLTMLAKNTTTGLVGAPLNQMQIINDLRLYAQVVIKTVNVVISRCCFARTARTCS